MNKFILENMVCNKAEEDTDILIVKISFTLASTHESGIINGDDVYLLIGIYCFSDMYFLKPRKGKVEKNILAQGAIDNTIVNNILLIRAMCDCDTMSVVFNQEKIKFIQT